MGTNAVKKKEKQVPRREEREGKSLMKDGL